MLARLVPLLLLLPASSVQGLEIRGILLAGIMSRCPTTAASQRFWETRLQHLIADNLDTQTPYKSGHLRLGQAIQTRFSLPLRARDKLKLEDGRAWHSHAALHACTYIRIVST